MKPLEKIAFTARRLPSSTAVRSRTSSSAKSPHFCLGVLGCQMYNTAQHAIINRRRSLPEAIQTSSTAHARCAIYSSVLPKAIVLTSWRPAGM